MENRIETAVILAAGKGTRLRPYTNEIPKGFISVGEERLVERSIRILKNLGIKQVIIGTGYLKEHYEKYAEEHGLKTFLNPDYANTGSFHTLYSGKDLIDGDFLLLESDLLYHSDAIRSLIDSDGKDVILCSGFTKSEDEVYVEVKNGLLKNLSKKKEELDDVSAELVGIWKISKELMELLMKEYDQIPDARHTDYERAIAWLSSKHQVNVLKLEDLVWCEIDNEEHLERAKKLIYPKIDK